jgi:ATP-dependent helicase/nuclease subunit A
MRIDIADISTIHSFCRKIISDNFYRLGIDPAFNIIEGDEQKLLREEILAGVVEKAWESENISAELKNMLEGRDPDLKKGVLKNIYAIDEFLNSLVDPEKWIDMNGRDNSGLLRQRLIEILHRRIDVCRSLCDQARMLDGKLVGGFYKQDIQDFRDGLDTLEEFVKTGSRKDIDSQLDHLRDIKFKSRPRNTPEEDYVNARSPVTEIAKKKILEKLKKELVCADMLGAVEESAAKDTAALLAVVEMFRQEYKQRKQELKCLDFGDLERLALKVLSCDDGSPSPVAQELREHYQYVFVDEYQDVNKVQDRIVELVSAGANRFIVGDVKQSIYSWRQARPELFLSRLDNAAKSGATNIYLNENFRCRRGVVDFVNFFFGRLMSRNVAGMDYDKEASLAFGASWYLPLDEVCRKKDTCSNELHIVSSAQAFQSQGSPDDDGDGEDMLEQTTSNQRQAAVIARRIRELVGDDKNAPELKIARKDTSLIDVSYGDIVILLRSLKGRVNDYVDVLRQFNIPVEASVTGNYFESPEVNDCLCILKVLDNPMRDIELAASMRSPIFGFSDSELLEIRGAAKSSKAFYNCLLDYTVNGADAALIARIGEMLKTLEDWRQMACRSHLAQVLWLMLRHNDFLSFVSALPGGLQKRGDLLKLHERAIQFEGFVSTRGNPSLGRFVDFIERLRDSEGDWSQAEADTPQSGSVRIMSIHKSKGLEFPVVFMPAMERGFNITDTKEICLLDEDLPIGLKVYLARTGNKYATDSFNVIKEKKLVSSVAEEMRTLYVAMTRAREKLIMVADTTAKDKAEPGSYILSRLDELEILTQRNVFDWWISRSGSRSYLDWLIASCSEDSLIRRAVEKGGRIKDLEVVVAPACDISFESNQPAPPADRCPVNADEREILKELKWRLTAEYEYQGVLELPVKNSVSGITHRDDEFKVDYFAKSIEDVEIFVGDDENEKTDPRLIGTATHLVFEHLNIDSKPDQDDVERVIERLVNSKAVAPDVAAMINASEILAFFDTEPGRLLFDDGVKVYREYPFTIALSPTDCGFSSPQESKGDDIIVQGVVDMLIDSPQGAVIVDFKTDNVTARSVEKRAEVYKKQIRLYSFAVSKICKRSVSSGWLYFLKPAVAYRC